MTLIRNGPVDILRYVPEFLASDSDFKLLHDCESREHERIRLALGELFKQFFIPVATEKGIEKWEQLIGIIPQKGSDIEARRRAVLLWLQSNQVSTPKFMLNMIKRYYDEEASVKLDEHNEEYYFSITSNKFPKDLQGLTTAIEMYKPAHLGYVFNAVLHDVDKNGEIDIASGIGEYHGMVKSVLGHKYIKYDSDGFDSKCDGFFRQGIASVRHGNKTLGGSADIVQNNKLGTYTLHTMYGARIIEAEWPDNLPMPKHEFHFTGLGRLYDGVIHIAKGYRIIETEIPKNLPPKQTKFVFTDIGDMSHGLICCVSGIRTVEAEPIETIHPDVDIRVELEAGGYAAAIHAHRGIKTINSERIHIPPFATDIEISERATGYTGTINWKTGVVIAPLEASLKAMQKSKGVAGTINVITGSRYLNVGNINEDDETRLTAGGIVSTTGSRNIKLAVDVPEKISTDTSAGIYEVKTGSRLAELAKPDVLHNVSSLANINIIGGSEHIDMHVDRHSAYASGEDMTTGFKYGSTVCISKHYIMLVDGHQDVKYIKGAVTSCNIKAGATASMYKKYIISCNEEENN